ncbi:MAG: hypothetical protein WDM84_04660 [Bauldia sp.]
MNRLNQDAANEPPYVLASVAVGAIAAALPLPVFAADKLTVLLDCTSIPTTLPW